jgi:cob(I)alamin adenosyltransferase
LSAAESVGSDTLAYLNRLSDLLFVLCRILMRAAEQVEVMWEAERLGDDH